MAYTDFLVGFLGYLLVTGLLIILRNWKPALVKEIYTYCLMFGSLVLFIAVALFDIAGDSVARRMTIDFLFGFVLGAATLIHSFIDLDNESIARCGSDSLL